MISTNWIWILVTVAPLLVVARRTEWFQEIVLHDSSNVLKWETASKKNYDGFWCKKKNTISTEHTVHIFNYA